MNDCQKKKLRTQISLTENKSTSQHGVNACNLSTREVETGGLWGSLASQQSLMVRATSHSSVRGSALISDVESFGGTSAVDI